jgi:hypothetical protein
LSSWRAAWDEVNQKGIELVNGEHLVAAIAGGLPARQRVVASGKAERPARIDDSIVEACSDAAICNFAVSPAGSTLKWLNAVFLSDPSVSGRANQSILAVLQPGGNWNQLDWMPVVGLKTA